MDAFSNVSVKSIVVRAVFLISIVVILVTIFYKENTQTVTNNMEVVENQTPKEPLKPTIEFDPDSYNISISSDIRIDNKTYVGRANIMNIQNENECFIVDIVVDESQEKIYQSEYIYNEEVVEHITINNELVPGKYPSTATFSVYDRDTKEYLTKIELDIDVTIVNSL